MLSQMFNRLILRHLSASAAVQAKVKRYGIMSFLALLYGCQATPPTPPTPPTQPNTPLFSADQQLVYYNDSHLQQVQEKIQQREPYFYANYLKVIAAGEEALSYVVDPVTNKTVTPPSGDKHDYLTYPPYRWPDPTKADGLPWIPKDGVINPVSRTSATDFVRGDLFFEHINKLSWAFYFSNDSRYAEKALDSIRIWYLNPETAINPNINFGQGTPGLSTGSRAGLIDWKPQESVITALQIFAQRNVLPEDVKQGMHQWFTQYLNWLMTSPIAIAAGETGQNHANYYNYQRVGLHLYLGNIDTVKAIVEDAKHSRIAVQIQPDGFQPKEMGRTRSVHYAVFNTWSMTELLLMGRKVGIDLWAFQTEDGRSLKKAYDYLRPYAEGKKEWLHRDIDPGGAKVSIEKQLKPLFSRATTSIGVAIIDANIPMHHNLSSLDALRYPPLHLLK